MRPLTTENPASENTLPVVSSNVISSPSRVINPAYVMILTNEPVLALCASGTRYQPRTMRERNAPLADLTSNCLSSAKALSGSAEVIAPVSPFAAVRTTAPGWSG